MARPARTLLEVCLARQGMRRGGAVVGTILNWSVASAALDREITLQDYADWWKLSRATAFRDQQRFRECFPGHETPQAIVNALQAQRDAKIAAGGFRDVASFPAGLLPA